MSAVGDATVTAAVTPSGSPTTLAAPLATRSVPTDAANRAPSSVSVTVASSAPPSPVCTVVGSALTRGPSAGSSEAVLIENAGSVSVPQSLGCSPMRNARSAPPMTVA